MPKKSIVAIATSQTQSQTFTAEQAIQRHTDTAPMFAVYVMLDGGEVDGITQGIRHYVGTAQTRKEANAKGLQALTKYENAITCEIVEISDKPYRLYIEGSDREAWVTGLFYYFATESEAHAYAKRLYEHGRHGVTFSRHTVKNVKTDYFCGVVQPSKWYGRDLEPIAYVYGKAMAL